MSVPWGGLGFEGAPLKLVRGHAMAVRVLGLRHGSRRLVIWCAPSSGGRGKGG